MSPFATAGAWIVTQWAQESDAEFDPNQVTPGWEGFVMTAVFAVAIIILGTLLVRRLRRNLYRDQVREEIQQELAERGGSEDDASPSGTSTN